MGGRTNRLRRHLYQEGPDRCDRHTWENRRPPRTLDGRIDTGTLNFAAAHDHPGCDRFSQQIGTAAKEARLRYLRNLWVAPARKMKGLTVLTPDDGAMVAGADLIPS